MAVLFPTDLQQQQPSDKIVLLAADKDNVAKNVRVGDLVQYIRDNVPLETLIETNRSQQATISLQQDNIDRLTDDVDSIRNDMQRINIPANTLEQELSVGKTDIAEAITAKGVETAATDSLATMADNVREIVQETTTINGGEFYPQNMLGTAVWNLFEVAAMVKSRYISSGRYAGAIVAQYYKGYATLDLTSYGGGYAACLTSDGDFYANDGEHTAIGVHTWHDDDSGKADRYVVFLWLEDDYTFQTLSSGVCPREIVVLGTCASLQVNYNRLVQLYAPAEFGELKNFRLAGSNTPEGNWAAVQVWEHYKEHTTGTIFQNANNLVYAEFTNLERVTDGIVFYATTTSFNNLNEVAFPNLETMSGGTLFNFYNTSSANSLSVVLLPRLKTISGGTLFNALQGQSLSSVSFPALTTISGGTLFTSQNNANTFAGLKSVSFPSLTTISGGTLFYCEGGLNALTSVSFPSLTTISGGNLFYVHRKAISKLTRLDMPNLETITSTTAIIAGGEHQDEMIATLTVYAPKLRSLPNTVANTYGMFAAATNVYLNSLEVGIVRIAGSSSQSTFRTKYILLGCKGTSTQRVGCEGYYTATIQIEIGDKEHIDAGLEPRWQPRQPLNLAKINMSAENIALLILDRLADNTDGAAITISIGTTNYNRISTDETYAPYLEAAVNKNYIIN